MGKVWTIFFMAAAVAAVVLCLVAPSQGWWFPGTEIGQGHAASTIGQRIDSLFYLILIITSITFIGVNIALGYVLWTGASATETGTKAVYSHGSHALEVIWTVVPAAILLFIALYQMDVWASYRMRTSFPKTMEPIAEVTARQFEWRIRYPAKGKKLQPKPQPDDLYTVNDLHVPTNLPVAVTIRSDDVQHAFFVPKLRVKQDVVPGLLIPVWFEVTESGVFDFVCAELCGWGHYKMKARVVAETAAEFEQWKTRLQADQFDDGLRTTSPKKMETASRD